MKKQIFNIFQTIKRRLYILWKEQYFMGGAMPIPSNCKDKKLNNSITSKKLTFMNLD